MNVSPFGVALWVELLAAALGGLQGALFAAEQRHRRIDVLGVIVIGLVVALGGSVLRDILLNQPPVAIWRNWYLVVAGAMAVIGMILQPLVARAGALITLLDALVMGLFAVIGATKALSLGVGPVGAAVIGVIAAIGGGLLRDVFLGLPVSFLQVGTLYACAAGAGASALVLLVALGVPIPYAAVVCVGMTGAVRVAALLLGWVFPEQRPLWPRRPRTSSATDVAEPS